MSHNNWASKLERVPGGEGRERWRERGERNVPNIQKQVLSDVEYCRKEGGRVFSVLEPETCGSAIHVFSSVLWSLNSNSALATSRLVTPLAKVSVSPFLSWTYSAVENCWSSWVLSLVEINGL